MTHERKTIAKIERARNSVFGCPSFWITFTDYQRVKTAANAAFAYQVGNGDMREGCDVEVFFSARGTIKGMSPATDAR